MAKNYVEVKPTQVNKTYSRDYYNKIGKMINKMNNEVMVEINKVIFSLNEKEIATDAMPTHKLLSNKKSINISFNNLLKEFKSVDNIIKTWQRKFNKISLPFSEYFVNTISKYSTKETEDTIKKVIGNKAIKVNKDFIGFLEIKDDMIKENVDLIKSIPATYKDKILEKVKQSAKEGRNLNLLHTELMKIGGMTDRRARNIAIDQNNKITSIVNNERLKEYGFTKSKWLHSGASKEPRHSHIKATGKIFDINKGCLIDGEYIFPGQLINCKCVSTPIIEI